MSDEIFLTFVRDGVGTDLVVPIVSGTGADLFRAAVTRFGESIARQLRIERTGVGVAPELTIVELGVLTGDRILVGWHAGETARSSTPHRLIVVEGPDEGRVVELPVGKMTIGRGTDGPGRVGLNDATVSRRHAELVVSPDAVRLEDLGSTNGTEFNGHRVVDGHLLQTGDLVRFGDTVLKAQLAESAVAQRHLSRSSGRMSFNREPRVTTPDPAATFDIDAPPSTPQKRRFPLPAAVLPVVMGVVIFLVLGSPYFLLLAAVGPLMVIWTTIDDRRSGRREFALGRDRFLERLRVVKEGLSNSAKQRKVWLEDRHPNSSVLAQRATDHDRRLWRRRTRDDDFISVRVGTGDLSSRSQVRLPQSGDEDLVAQAATVAAEFALESRVPLVVALYDRPILGVVHHADGVTDLVRSLVTQLATDQSPRDVALAILAPGHSADWEFAKWLPHVQALGQDLRLVADGDDQAKALFRALRGLVEQRLDASEEVIGSGRSQFSPHVVVVIHPPAKLARREVTEFLERAPQVGISVIWVDTDRASLPGQCTTVIDQSLDSTTVTFTDSGAVLEAAETESVSQEAMEMVARGIASLVDVSSGADNVIPSRVDLLDLLQMPSINGDAVRSQWGQPRNDLSALIGADADGPVEVDWRLDGPHALVAGTTGAGKSELLQSLVASMAVMHPPTRVTFVLVDYKGGSAFKDCAGLPHTVGMVTDLDDHLAERALVSLRAELKLREHLLADHGAKDIVEMTNAAPDVAPPNMLIIIDEFAALKSEVPEFVDGVIDIAQRGRSLGVHLLLATQQPSGVIDPKIQGNTNLRIALRVADQADSVDVIGRADAHQISRSNPGRGYLRTGPSDVSEFQSAYVGGSDQGGEDLDAVTFHFGIEERAQIAKALADPSSVVTDLKRLVAATSQAALDCGMAEPRLPWVDPLPDEVLYTSLAKSDTNSQVGAVVGLADHPDRQIQRPFVIDFEEHANAAIYGSSGSGKTSMLRTIAMDLALRQSADRLWMYVLDYASRGLGSLDSLPHCGGVVSSDDLGRTRRLLEVLTRITDERRQELARVSAAGPAEYESITATAMARIVVFIDGFGQLWEALDGIDRSEHLTRLASLFADGRSVGVHFVVTADRRLAVPANIGSMISARFMLRMSEPDEYLNFGLPHLARSKAPVDGRAFTPEGVEFQVAVLNFAESTAAAAQSRAIVEVSAHMDAPTVAVPRAELLPKTVDYHQLTAANGLEVPIGLEEASLGSISVDFGDSPTFIVFGPDRSGRSTTLQTLIKGLERSVEGAYLLAGRRSPLLDLPLWDGSASGSDDAAPIAELLLKKFEARIAAGGGGAAPILVVLDDGDEFDEGPVANALNAIIRRARDANFLILASMTTFAGMRCYSPWAKTLRSNRSGLLLQPDLEDDGDLFGLRLPQRSGLKLPEGRGFLVSRGGTALAHVGVTSLESP